MSTTEKHIVKSGRKLAALDPSNKMLLAAREWWANGRISRYSNEDFDVLNGLHQAILSIEKPWNN